MCSAHFVMISGLCVYSITSSLSLFFIFFFKVAGVGVLEIFHVTESTYGNKTADKVIFNIVSCLICTID